MIANQKIGSVRDVLPVLEAVIQSSKPILIIADDVEGESFATLVVNKLRGHVHARGRQGPGLPRAAGRPPLAENGASVDGSDDERTWGEDRLRALETSASRRKATA